MVDHLDDEDEEEVQSRPRRHYFPHDTYSAAFRAVPSVRRRGAQSVHEEDTLGDLSHCWCGERYDHDWPGKAQGRGHPKGTELPNTTGEINRNQLRAYNSALQDFILHEVRVNNLPYRFAGNSILLYPPDGTNPVSVYARSNDKQISSLAAWHQKHVEEFLHPTKVVDQRTVEALAAAKNDPIEHPVKQKEEPVAVATEEAPVPPTGKMDLRMKNIVRPVDIEPALDDTWNWHLSAKGEFVEGIATDGESYVCVFCYNTDHPFLADKVTSVGGHRRYYHSPESDRMQQIAMENMARGREKKQQQREQAVSVKATPVKRDPHTDPMAHLTPAQKAEAYKVAGGTRTLKNQQLKDVRKAIVAMCISLDWWPTPPGTTTNAEVAINNLDLQAKLDRETARANEAERQLANIRDALGLK